jgi:hypothetical protein
MQLRRATDPTVRPRLEVCRWSLHSQFLLVSQPRRSRRPADRRRRAGVGAGGTYRVLWHPEADAEQAAIADAGERVVIQNAREKLETAGPRLGAPHSSAIQGTAGAGLRELRPRGGRSRWRPIYRQVGSDTFVILAVGPEAQIDQRGLCPGRSSRPGSPGGVGNLMEKDCLPITSLPSSSMVDTQAVGVQIMRNT